MLAFLLMLFFLCFSFDTSSCFLMAGVGIARVCMVAGEHRITVVWLETHV